MENHIKIGDRVDVKMIITEPWESEAGMSNGILRGIRDFGDFKSFWIDKDRKTSKMDFCRFLNSGHYINTKYQITKHKN